METIFKELQTELTDSCFNPNVTIIIFISNKNIESTYCLNGGGLEHFSITPNQICFDNGDNFTKIYLRNTNLKREEKEYIFENEEMIVSISFCKQI